jgi:hypothetical protein
MERGIGKYQTEKKAWKDVTPGQYYITDENVYMKIADFGKKNDKPYDPQNMDKHILHPDDVVDVILFVNGPINDEENQKAPDTSPPPMPNLVNK